MNMPCRSLVASWLLLLAAAPGCARLSQALNSALPNRAQQTKTQYSVARLQERQGNLVQAKQKYEEIVRQNPRNVDARHRLAVVHSRLGDLDQADRYFQEALDLAPAHGEVWCDLGYALYMHNDPTGAEEALRQALECDPGNKRATNNLALVLGQQDRFDESLAMFRKCGTEAEAHANLAYVYTQSGRGQKAIEHYSRALDLDQDLTVAKAALVQLAAMKAKAEPQAPVDPVLVAEAAEILRQMGPLPERRTSTNQRPVAEPFDGGGSQILPTAAVAPPEARSQEEWAMPRNVQAVGWANGEERSATAGYRTPQPGGREPGTWREEETSFGISVEPWEVAPREVVPDDMQRLTE